MYGGVSNIRHRVKMEKFIGIKEVADYLAVSPKTVYYWTHIQFIPHYRLPKAIRFKLSEVDNWLHRRKRRGRETVGAFMRLN